MISLSDLRKRKWFAEAFSALGFIVVALVLVVPYLTKGEFFLGSDGVSFFATKKFYIDSLFSGDFAFWTKYLLGGMPSEIGGTITYPPIFIFGLLPLNPVWLLFLFDLKANYRNFARCDSLNR